MDRQGSSPGGESAFRPRLLVTVHDVAPPFAEGVGRLLEELDRLQIERRVLKVIPNLDGRWLLTEDRRLCSLLQREVARGNEIVAHGWTHSARGPLRGSPRQRFLGARFAPQAAEFLTRSAGSAQRAAESARAVLADALGVEPRGFCAPGWLLNDAGRAGVAAAGFGYLMEQSRLRDLATGRTVLTPWQGFMGVGGIHEWLVQLGNGAIAVGARIAWDGLERCPNVKVYLHPQNLAGGGALDRVLERLESLKNGRQLVTAGQLLDLAGPATVAADSPDRIHSPSISVVIPALNEQAHVARALDSVRRQRYPADRLEAVLVDNDSKDDTLAEAEKVAAAWSAQGPGAPRLQLLKETGSGAAQAKNSGAAAARGEVLIFLDADSTLGVNVAGAVAAAWRSGARGGSIKVLADSDDVWERGFFGVMEFGKALLGVHCQMGYLDRGLFARLGGFRRDLRLAEDVDLMRRAARWLRFDGGRLQRVGAMPLVGDESDEGLCIMTSPRRLRGMPWRLGMFWMLLRWSLGFLGIGRGRYPAGGPAPNAPPPPTPARRIAMAILRLVLLTAAHRSSGRPAGLLWIWWLWDRLYVRWHGLRPVSEGSVLYYGFETYRAPRPVRLGDGTTVARGDRVCRIHMRNEVLAGSEYALLGKRAWGFIRAMRRDLAVLTENAESGAFNKRDAGFVAVTGATLLFRGARRMGFSVWPRPRSWRSEIERIYLLGLLALYRRDSETDRELLAEGRSSSATVSANVPEYELGEVWIGRRSLGWSRSSEASSVA
ncbi:MAG: glycosyltransferase [Chloroflexi bacterium]|nr:glycosyltransferase [Chloroflexota bacterium]MYC48501.1 glycosyltransferase [Chloroflexota bacterium]